MSDYVELHEECAKAFEDFCILWGYKTEVDSNGFFVEPITQRVFDAYSNAWQVSRAALVVELPKHDSFAAWVSQDMADGYKSAIGDVRDALDAAGVAYNE